jgi:hypothetical protein
VIVTITLVAPTGIDPVTFRFSVSLKVSPHYLYCADTVLIRDFSEWSQLLTVRFPTESAR